MKATDWKGIFALLCLLNLSACQQEPSSSELWAEFSGTNAMEHAQNLVALGPRPAGSEALERARKYLIGKLEAAGWRVQRQAFTAVTPRGELEFSNLIARHEAVTEETLQEKRCFIATHYETKYYSGITFVGANDGTSGAAALLEMARVLSLNQALAKRIDLIFFDGEEALVNFSESDGLYGSRHFADELRESGRSRLYDFGILWDMIGDRELSITLPADSPATLAKGIFDAAATLGYRQFFSFMDTAILDDHVPINRVGINCIDVIDFDYPHWHTAEDTLDKLSPESLKITGQVTLRYLESLR